MSNPILVFGSYRSDRMGIRLAEFVVERLRRRGEAVELIDAKAVNLPMLDRMYKEYPAGEAPERLDRLAGKIRDADGFVFVTGEYNWACSARAEKPDGSFSGGMVLAPRCDRELFGGTFVGAGRNRLAWHAVRDGDGGGFKHNCRWPDWTDPRGRCVRRWAKAARPSNDVYALRRRSDVVGRSGKDAATTQAAAFLIAYQGDPEKSSRNLSRGIGSEDSAAVNLDTANIGSPLALSEVPRFRLALRNERRSGPSADPSELMGSRPDEHPPQ